MESRRDIRCVDSNDCYCLGRYNGYNALLWTSNGGSNWKSTFYDGEKPDYTKPFPYDAVRIAYPNKNHIFLGFENGLLIKTKDNFKTRDSVLIKPVNITDPNYERKIRFLYMKDSLFGIAGSNSFLCITNDGWKTYRDLSGFDEIVPEGYRLNFGLTYGNQVFIIDSLNFFTYINAAKQIGEFEFIRRTGIANTTDGGITWNFYELCNTKTNSDLKKYIDCFYFVNKLLGFAVGNDSWDRSYIYKTTDGGKTWETKFEDPLGLSTNLLEIAFSDEMNGMAVGKKGEVRVTYDGGETWVNETFAKDYDTRMGRIVQHLAYKGKSAYISTYSDGIWKGTFPTTSVDENYVNCCTIYPNPSSDYITISCGSIGACSYDNGASPIATVQIFNTLGIEVSFTGGGRSEVDGGGYRIEISHLPAGVYFIKIGEKVEKFVKM